MPQEEPEGGDPLQYATIKVGRQAVWPLSLDSSLILHGAPYMLHAPCYVYHALIIAHMCHYAPCNVYTLCLGHIYVIRSYIKPTECSATRIMLALCTALLGLSDLDSEGRHAVSPSSIFIKQGSDSELFNSDVGNSLLKFPCFCPPIYVSLSNFNMVNI